MKKLLAILGIVVLTILAASLSAKANSLAVHLIGNDNLTPSYGLSISSGEDMIYSSLEVQTNKGFATNAALLSGGLQLGPINFGGVVGGKIQSSTGSASGMLGAELGITAKIAGPLFIRENNRVLRGAGGVSNGQVDLGLGLNF